MVRGLLSKKSLGANVRHKSMSVRQESLSVRKKSKESESATVSAAAHGRVPGRPNLQLIGCR